jgi:hypothetical protein
VNVDSRGRGVCEPQVAGCDDALSNHAGLSSSAARPAVRFFRRLWGPSLCCWTVAFSLSRKGLAVRWPARCIEARYENGRDDEHPPRQRLRRQLASRFRTGRRAACGVQRSAFSSDMLLADSRRRCTSSRLPGPLSTAGSRAASMHPGERSQQRPWVASACHRRPQHRGPAQRRSERLPPAPYPRTQGLGP